MQERQNYIFDCLKGEQNVYKRQNEATFIIFLFWKKKYYETLMLLGFCMVKYHILVRKKYWISIKWELFAISWKLDEERYVINHI